jgi:hypothetical protein
LAALHWRPTLLPGRSRHIPVPSAAGLFGWLTLPTGRMTGYGPAFIRLLATGLLAWLITGMALGARRR